jgi:hypothetical protein
MVLDLYKIDVLLLETCCDDIVVYYSITFLLYILFRSRDFNFNFMRGQPTGQ